MPTPTRWPARPSGRSWDGAFGLAPARRRRANREGISGFAAAWALFHDVLPGASRLGSIDPETIAAAARAVDVPDGALPNGAGLHFSSDPTRLGQNERSAAVIWQWQGVRQSVTVWPAVLASGTIAFVPLPR